MRCEVCEEGIVKYTCPRCCVKTCCLKCVKQHKADTSCDGQRDKTAYVCIKDFTDINLLTDYRFLEDAARKSDSCQRDPVRRFHHLPRHLNMLLREAKKRGTTLKLLPHVFTKRKRNQTRFIIKSQEIIWHVEWTFPQADDAHYVSKFSETERMSDCLASYVDTEVADPVIQHRLQKYITRRREDGIRLFLKRGQQQANTHLYDELDVNKSLGENLKDKYIVEYPTIHAVLGDHGLAYQTELTSVTAEKSSGTQSVQRDGEELSERMTEKSTTSYPPTDLDSHSSQCVIGSDDMSDSICNKNKVMDENVVLV